MLLQKVNTTGIEYINKPVSHKFFINLEVDNLVFSVKLVKYKNHREFCELVH